MVDELGTNPLNLYVHNNDYTERQRLSGYIDVELNDEFGFNAGVGQLTIPADHKLAGRIMQSSTDVVPITAHRNGWKWTGRVDSYVATGKPGRETITATLVHDLAQLGNIVAWTSTRTPLAVQIRHDHQGGPLESVAYHYLSENIARSGLPAYVMMPPPRYHDKSPKVDVVARMTPLDVLLRDVLDEHDYNVHAEMWWPGEPFPDGKMVPLSGGSTALRQTVLTKANLDQTFNPDGPRIEEPRDPGLIVRVTPVSERPHVRFSTNGQDITQFKLSGTSPGPATAIVGGKADDWINEAIGLGVDFAVQGILTQLGSAAGPAGALIGGIAGGVITDMLEDTIFSFTDRVDVHRKAEMGPFHPRESFTQSSSGVFTYDTQALAERALVDTQGGQAIEIELADGISKNLGEDTRADNGKIRYGYRVGDRCKFEEHLSGVVVSDIITGVKVTDRAGERMRVVPRIGKAKNMSNPWLDFMGKFKKLLAYQQDVGMSS